MRIAKWTALVAAGLVLLLIAGVFVATRVIDPNRYRGQVERLVTDLAGRRLVIEGDLKIAWYPWLGVRMGRAHLVDPTPNSKGDPSEPLAEWNSVFVAARLIPLLRGRVMVDRIRLESPHFRLRRDAEGQGNWEGVGPKPSAAGKGPPARTGSPSAAAQTPPEIAGLEIRDGVLDYQDDQSGTRLTLSALNLDVGAWHAGEPLPVSTKLVIHHPSLPPKGVPLTLEIPRLAVRLAPGIAVSAPKATLTLADARINSDFSFEAAKAQGSTQLHVPSLRRLAGDLALDTTLPHDPTTLGSLDLTTSWSYADGSLAARPLTLQLDGVNFTGWLERTAAPSSAWTFELHGDRIDLGRYVKVDSKSTRPFEIPVDTLRAFNANGSVIFDQAVLADARMTDVRLRFQTPADSRQ